MRTPRVIYLGALCTLLACSKEDTSPQEKAVDRTNDFTVIGEDADQVYQYTYTANTEEGQLFNLTEALGVMPNYLTLRQVNDQISVYSFSGGRFSLVTKDLVSGATGAYPNFYTVNDERSLAWGINSHDTVYFGFFTPDRDLALHKVPLSGGDRSDLVLDTDVAVTFQPFWHQGKIYISYRDNQENYKLRYYDTLNGELSPIFSFRNQPFSFVISDSGELLILKNDGSAFLERYDAHTFSFIDQVVFAVNTGFSPGPVSGAVLENDRLYYALGYAQPSRYPFGPAIYDLGNQENTVINLTALADTIAAELDTPIALTTQRYDSVGSVFLVGYALMGDTVGGGVLQVSTQGELLAHVTLPFVPTFVVKTNL